ncbi:MAG: hypothetical protein DMF74_08330 [Acidobacteria bacterium]|nr:MAG: hypothetical protein DMF74_08330 [Acidobacteriota bacterium]
MSDEFKAGEANANTYGKDRACALTVTLVRQRCDRISATSSIPGESAKPILNDDVNDAVKRIRFHV